MQKKSYKNNNISKYVKFEIKKNVKFEIKKNSLKNKI